MPPRLRPLVAALGLLGAFAAHADKGGIPHGLANGGNSANGRGGARFADSPGPGPANAFDNRAQLVKGGGLEFQATANARAPSVSSHEQKPRDDAVVLTPAAGPSDNSTPAQDELALAFAPWKVTDKDGKPAEKKPLECRSK